MYYKLMVQCAKGSLFAFSILFFGFLGQIKAQGCSNPNITAKYWQYRKNLKHFVAVDRDSLFGCVNDGIGQDTANPCSCTKQGFGLPGTAIVQTPDGSREMGERNQSDNPWYDPACANHVDSTISGTHWDTLKNKVHNLIDMGSETPQQLGWYWVVLASEYQLLKDQGQTAEAQRTLEELFLALQAYRRLDITANCLVRDRYQEISDNFEVERDCGTVIGVNAFGIPITIIDNTKVCLCSFNYRNGGNNGCDKKNFDSPCNGYPVCQFTPRTDGFSGFFIREDATQSIERILHDDSEDKWNIDVIKSDHAFSLRPPCTTSFSPACYNVRRQNFMSQDQAIGLMIGLAMIKRLIPENATVTTCDGKIYKPLDIAVKITSAIVNRMDNTYSNRISWPGSSDKSCCKKEAFLSNCEGGQGMYVMKGLKKVASYVDGASRNSSVREHASWSLLHGLNSVSGNSNEMFWVRLKALGWDMGGDGRRPLFESTCETRGLDILPLMNNLLYPQQPDIGINKELLKRMLCSAPCEGPCHKAGGYPIPGPKGWPEFDCPNVIGWMGQKWENTNPLTHHLSWQSNGLDYMALHNLFMLYFPEEKENYFNPERPDGNIAFNADKISGPNILCPVDTGSYSISSPSSNLIQSISWKTSSNLEILNSQGVTALVRSNSPASLSFIQANLGVNSTISQYYFAKGNLIHPIIITTGPDVIETCEINYRKPIITENPIYFEHVIAPCFTQCYALTKGAFTPGDQVFWNITTPGGLSKTGSGDYIEFCEILDLNSGGLVTIQLNVNSVSCGNYTIEKSVLYEKCPDILPQRKIIVNPNPADNYVTFTLSRNNQPYAPPPAGANIMVNRMPMSTNYMSSTMYSSSQSFNIATLPNGVYQVTVSAQDFEPTSTTFVISRY
jgi:hypothetical protein